ncbi:hypothetical protein [Agarivorans sp. Toyoura001]|uniref:hypothetical protein n=1 Tax=unclassified Agarivorans TaxID=2636026 RepID=UPI0010D00519|nr:hypothetical protein [Agarivorans sp. Toyoura001]GDY27981.1 hypothetical protein AHAT_38710 [Agarivorans sp. Toyoura001]
MRVDLATGILQRLVMRTIIFTFKLLLIVVFALVTFSSLVSAFGWFYTAFAVCVRVALDKPVFGDE